MEKKSFIDEFEINKKISEYNELVGNGRIGEDNKKLRILINDRDKLSAGPLITYFSELGHTVTYTRNIEEAIKSIEKKREDGEFFDLCFTDTEPIPGRKQNYTGVLLPDAFYNRKLPTYTVLISKRDELKDKRNSLQEKMGKSLLCYLSWPIDYEDVDRILNYVEFKRENSKNRNKNILLLEKNKIVGNMWRHILNDANIMQASNIYEALAYWKKNRINLIMGNGIRNDCTQINENEFDVAQYSENNKIVDRLKKVMPFASVWGYSPHELVNTDKNEMWVDDINSKINSLLKENVKKIKEYHQVGEGNIYAITGPKTGGKTTLADSLLLIFLEEIIKLPRAVTKLPRVGEMYGDEHYFFSEKKFKQMILENKFLHWYANVNKNEGGKFLSGILNDRTIEWALSENHDVILPMGSYQAVDGFKEHLVKTGKQWMANKVKSVLLLNSPEVLITRVKERNWANFDYAESQKEVERFNPENQDYDLVIKTKGANLKKTYNVDDTQMANLMDLEFKVKIMLEFMENCRIKQTN